MYVYFSESELVAFNTIGFNSFNQVFLDLSQVKDELSGVGTGTEQNIETCKVLEDEAEVSVCLTEVHDAFSAQSADILNRILELHDLGAETLSNAETSQREFNAGNREFVREGSEKTRTELITCIESL